MLNFDYHIGTEIFFGRGQLAKLPAAIRRHTDKVLLCYGGGSVKRTGLLAQVQSALCEAGISYVELAGVEPNPRTTTVDRGAALCRQHGLGGVLAVGGGSTIDCAKVVAAARFYSGPAWDLIERKAPVTQVLPVFSVLTLSATGSEMDDVAVISNWQTSEKRSIAHPAMRPVASVLDPAYTFTVPANQTAAGTADIMSHTLETYFSRCQTGYLQDRMAEAILKTCIHFGPIALRTPDDYTARANLMWASSHAINGTIALGKECPWSVHTMEHQLSACYDITHGVGLAILTPAWMRYVLSEATAPKFAEYGVNVWGLDAALGQMELARRAIDATRRFFVEELHLPATLREVGIGPERFDEMAQKAATPALQNRAYVGLGAADVKKIYEMCL